MPTEVSILRFMSIPNDVLETVREHARRCASCTVPCATHGSHTDTRFCPVAMTMVEGAIRIFAITRHK
jgi:hypothetical protein